MSPVDKVDTIALESLVLNEIVALVCQKLTDTQEHISEIEKMQIRLSFKPTAHIHAVLKTRASYALLQRDLLSMCCSSKLELYNWKSFSKIQQWLSHLWRHSLKSQISDEPSVASY